MANSIFSQAVYFNTRARQMRGRVDLLSQDVAKELNTYANFGVFHTYNDVHSTSWYDESGKGADGSTGTAFEDAGPRKGMSDVAGTPGVRSIFNKMSAALTATDHANAGNLDDGTAMGEVIKNFVHNASGWRISNNVPLLDTPETRKKIKEHSGCTVRELVKASQAGYFGVATYSYADFMYCKHLNRVPNNYLITLRRFPVPILDSIMPTGTGGRRKKGGAGYNPTMPPIGTMVTWLGVSGNDMKNILKYSYKMAFEEKNAQWEDVEKQGGDTGLLNGMEAMVNPAARKSYLSGQSVPALDGLMGTFFNAGQSPYPPANMGSEVQKDKTKIYGPIDRVKKAYARGSGGLDWDQEFTITFEYELKAYNGINPRQAMLDLIASILSVTYTTGGFWAGGYRGGGIRQSSFFSNLNVFKCRGGFTDFMDAVSKDIRAGANAIRQDISDSGGLVAYAKKMLNMIGGMLMGGVLNKLGRPARYFANSLISDAPVGLWHITIGNPHHPIMMMGNMILLNTEIEHSGPLGIDDFPTNLKVSCQFKRGKPRDQYGIENLYMQGNDRIFHSMESKLADMYRVAQAYKAGDNNVAIQIPKQSQGQDTEVKNSTTQASTGGAKVVGTDASTGGTQLDGSANSNTGQMPQDPTPEMKKQAEQITTTFEEAKDCADQWKYWFGIDDGQAVITAAAEAGRGGFKKAPVEKPDADAPAAKKDGDAPADTNTETTGDKKKANGA